MPTLQQRMAEVLGDTSARGLQAEIARLCKKSRPTVSAWINNPDKVTTISRSDAELICARWKPEISPAWLAEGVLPKMALPGSNHLGGPNENVSAGPKQNGPYPLISDVIAGDWAELCDSFQPGDAEDWFPSTKNLGSHGYMLRVYGKSMENPGGRYSFPDGMILHVNPSMEPMPGQFVIVRRESTKEATFKKYVLIEGVPFLEAINPDWPRELKYLALQPGDVWCGVVVDASIGSLP